jgi:uncharacterized peroxidase-related enzyme
MSPRLPSLPPQVPGMLALGAYRPDVYEQISALANNMLRTGHPDSTLAPSEREIIATYVSSLNNCSYCMTVHGAVAVAHICNAKSQSNGQATQISKAMAEEMVNSVCIDRKSNVNGNDMSPKLKRLLEIAAHVCENGQSITPENINAAKEDGATDMDIHDTVLIAALFSMFNRYVDGLTGEVLGNVEQLKKGGQMIAESGYGMRKAATGTS